MSAASDDQNKDTYNEIRLWRIHNVSTKDIADIRSYDGPYEMTEFKVHFGDSDRSTDEEAVSLVYDDMESDCGWVNVNLGELSDKENVTEEVEPRVADVEPMIKDIEMVWGRSEEECVLSDPDMEEFDVVEWDEFVAGEIPDEDK